MKKVLKSSLSLLLAIAIIFGSAAVGLTELDFSGLFAVKASAASIIESGTCGDNLTWTFDNNYTLTISGSGDMYNYDSSNRAPWSCPSAVVISEGVTSIGDYAFYYKGGFSSFVIPKSVTRIGDNAFNYCNLLTSIVIPNNVTSIGDSAFYECTSLTSVTIGDGVISIGDYAFGSCRELTSITIGNSVSSIGQNVFSGCNKLAKCIVSENNEYYSSIDDVLFNKDKTKLVHYSVGKQTSVYNIPDGVTYIEENAFWGANFISVSIPSSVKNIGSSAFAYCERLEKIYWNASNVDDFLSSSKVFVGAGTSGNGIEVVFGDTVENIPAYMFYFETTYGSSDLPKITSVVIGENVTTISDYAFYNCPSLASVTIGDSVSRIGRNSFYGCKSLTSIAIPNSVTVIDKYAFSNSGLTTVKIGNGVEFIGDGSFNNCKNLSFVDLGDTVTSIGEHSFAYTGITSIVLPDSLVSIGDGAFVFCESLETIEFSNGLTSIGMQSFAYCKKLSSVTIPGSLENIESDAFSFCYDLTSVTISEGVTCIASEMFESCDHLTTVTIPDTVTSIERSAFMNCTSLTSIDIPDSVTSIASKAFYGCTGLTSVTIPGSVTVLSDAFSNCTNLECVTIEDGVTRLAREAFLNCTKLVSVTIPGSVTDMWADSFENCTSLATVITPCGSYASLFFDESILRLIHSESAGWEVDLLPTCSSDGSKHGFCLVCEAFIENDVIPALGHRPDKDNICTVCGEQLPAPPRDYAIYVCDAETGEPIKDATVTLGNESVKTNSRGAAKFKLVNDDVTTLAVVANSYPDYPQSEYVPVSHSADYIYLASEESDIYNAWCNNKNVLTGNAQLNVMAVDLEARIVVNGRAKANILKYELLQDSVVIATSDNGIFNVPNSSFKVDKDVIVRMYTDGAEGHNVFERKLNINVLKCNFDVDKNIETLLSFGENLEITLPADTPGFPNFKVKIPKIFSENSNITCIHENDKVIIMLGFSKDFADDSTGKETSAEKILKKAYDLFVEGAKSEEEREVHASVALVVEFDEGGVTDVYGQANIGFNLKFPGGDTVWFAGVVPVYYEAILTLGGDLNLTKIKYDDTNDRLNMGYELILNGDIIGLFGLGWYILNIDIYGNATVKLEFGSELEAPRGTISGEFGLCIRNKLGIKWLNGNVALWKNSKTWPEQMSAVASLVYSAASYTIAEREYLENRTEWLNTALMSSSSNDVLLQDSTYTAIEPKIVACGDTIMMVFIDDDGSEGYNYQHLYYSIYDNASGGWSEPQKLDSNNRNDLEFDVYADDTTIYVAYTEVDSITEEDINDDAKILGTAEVVVAQYNVDEGCFVNHTKLTSNESFDTLPKISKTADGIMVSWVNDITNDVFSQSANNTIYYSVLSGQMWSEATALTERGATIVSMDVGTLDGKSYIAIIRDADCNLATSDDKVLCLIDINDNFTKLENVSGLIDGVQFIEMDGENRLIWYNGGNLYNINSVSSTPTAILSSPISGLTSNYKFVQIDNESCAIVFTRNEICEDGDGNTQSYSRIYGIFCNDGVWGNAIPLTQNEANYYVDAFDVSMCDGKMLIPYVNAHVLYTNIGIDRTTSFISTTFESGNDIVAGKTEVLPSTLFAGTNVEIYVPVTNNSWQSIEAMSYSIMNSQGVVVYRGIWNECIESGDTKYLVLTLSKNIFTPGESYSVQISVMDSYDSDISNNSSAISLWYTDFSITASQLVIPGNDEIQFTITNDGNIGGTTTLKVYRLDENGNEMLITEVEIPYLDVGASYSGSLVVTDDYYPESSGSGSIIVTVVYNSEELYVYNDTIRLTIKDTEYGNTTEADTSKPVVESPLVEEPYIKYDKIEGTDVSVHIIEKGWSFVGVNELSEENYSYSNGILTISKEYIEPLANGYYGFSVSYSIDGITTEVLFVVEVSDTSYKKAYITVENQEAKYDGFALVLGKDITYYTESEGEVSVEYSSDNGLTWSEGLPVEIGEYIVRINVEQDDENRYLSTSGTFNVIIRKGTRAISVPVNIGKDHVQVLFGDSIPTAGRTDGTILYGYSLTNDIATVTEWSETGVLPESKDHAIYYVFAKIINGEKYEDAYSLGYAIDAFVPASEHPASDWIIDVNATCTEDGSMHTECTVCGDVIETKVITALGHTSSGWIIDTNADCTKSGSKHKECTVCGETITTEAIPANGHKAVIDNAVAATCTKTGLTEGKHCSVCGEVIVAQSVIPANGHKETVDSAVAATCTKTGLTEGKHCSVCGEVFVAQSVIPAKGHTSSDWIIDRASTCTEAGFKHKECTVCGETIATESVASKGHVSSNWIIDTPVSVSAPGSKHKECTACGETLETVAIAQLKPATPKVATTNEIGGVNITWNAVDGAVKYQVYRRQGGSNTWTLVGTTTSTSLLDSNVSSGIYYVYSVRAYNSAGQYSDFISANTQTRKFMAVPKLKGISNATNGLYITWEPVAGVTNGYRVYRRGAGSTYWTYLGTTKNTYFTDTAVKNNSGEYFRYTVIADGGYHSKFDTTGLYLRRLSNPTLKSATSASAGITVKWTPVKGCLGYYVYRKTANSGWVRVGVVNGANASSYLDKTAKKGVTYTYTVRAVCGSYISYINSGISCKDKY